MKFLNLTFLSRAILAFPVFNITGLELGDQIEISGNHFQIHTPHHVEIHRGNRNNRCRGNRENRPDRENQENRQERENRISKQHSNRNKPEKPEGEEFSEIKLPEGSGYEFEIFEPNFHRFLKMKAFEENGFDIEFLPKNVIDENSKISSKSTFIEDGQNVLQTVSERSEKNAEPIKKKILQTQILPTEILPIMTTKSDVSLLTTLTKIEDFTIVEPESIENCAEKSFFVKNFCRMKSFYQSGKTWFSGLFGSK